MPTPITAETLLGLVRDSRTEVRLENGELLEVIDASSLITSLRLLVENEPEVVFREVLGMTQSEARHWLDARAPYLRFQHPVVGLVGPTAGSLQPGQLRVGISNGVIDEILDYRRPD